MIIVDPRIGSKELVPYFAPFDIPVQSSALEFGDVMHLGNGPDGPVYIAYERKVLTDMIQSMRSDRFTGHQLPGLLETYQVVHLIVEGIWKVGLTGAIEVPRRGGWEALYCGSRPVLYRELDHFISTLQYKRGIVYERTGNKQQTAEFIASRYRYWNDKFWHQHKSDEAIYSPFQPVVGGGNSRRATFTRRTVPVVEKMIAQLDGVDAAAYSIAKEVVNAVGLVEATEVELAKILVEQNGKKRRMVRLGPAKAKKIWEQLREM